MTSVEPRHHAQLAAFVHQWRPPAVSMSPGALGHSAHGEQVPENRLVMRGFVFVQVAWRGPLRPVSTSGRLKSSWEPPVAQRPSLMTQNFP